MKDCAICRVSSDVIEKISDVMFAKKRKEEAKKKAVVLTVVCASIAAVVGACVAAVVIISKKREENVVKVAFEKVKSKLKLNKPAAEELDDAECEENCEDVEVSFEATESSDEVEA